MPVVRRSEIRSRAALAGEAGREASDLLGIAGNGAPFPTPGSLYDKVHADDARPLLALALWNRLTVNDPSMLAVAQAVADVFFEACPE